ncbi:DUF1707 domain-containing protein [Nocardia sp. NPDC059240]|uniref:DUF1707 SHOCT-like domain-containing protein n=1 Tax=Nocardia sp. NPDC059240 TaxID=3346786 RepID=UPI00368BF812
MGNENMRASDADREQIVNKLRLAMDEGRLTLHEFDSRLQQVYSARTYGELTPVLSDLPAQRVAGKAAKGEPGNVPVWVKIMWTPWVFVNLLVLVVWVATGMGYFWPIWVEAPWGLALLIPTTIGIVVQRDSNRRRAAREEFRPQ